MAYEPQHTHTDPPTEPSSGWTGFALVKYGFIFLIVVALLYFAAVYLLPALTDGSLESSVQALSRRVPPGLPGGTLLCGGVGRGAPQISDVGVA